MKKNYIIILAFVLFALSCNQKTSGGDTNVREDKDSVKQEQITDVQKKQKPSVKDLEPFFVKQNTSSGTIIQAKEVNTEGNGIYCYFRLKNDKATGLRLRIQYWSEKYANADQYLFVVDGKSYTYIANRDKSGSGNDRVVESAVFYWFDNSMNKTDLAFVEKLADSKESSISLIDRATGETVTMLALTDSEKLIIRRTLDYYFALDGATIPKEGMVNIRG